MNNTGQGSGFTLIEFLVVFALLAVLAIIVLAAINPIEQLKKAKDTSRKIYASELLRAIERYQVREWENPAISPIAPYLSCSEIVAADPLSDLKGLSSELSSWFADKVTEPENRLYVGLLPHSGLTKICYQVESVANITRAWQVGCSANSSFYLCLSE